MVLELKSRFLQEKEGHNEAVVAAGESRKKKKVRVALEEKNTNAHTTFLVTVGIAVLDVILGTLMEET